MRSRSPVGISSGAVAMATSASGTVATKTSRQLATSTAIPPNAGPNAGARTTPTEKIPMAVPRWWSGKVWKIRNIDMGCNSGVIGEPLLFRAPTPYQPSPVEHALSDGLCHDPLRHLRLLLAWKDGSLPRSISLESGRATVKRTTPGYERDEGVARDPVPDPGGPP